MRTRARACAGLILQLLVAGLAGAQDATPVLAGDREASAELAKIVAATRARGLPIDPILERTQYAIMMHASPARTVAAARAIAGRLEIAREALAPRENPLDIAAAQVALSYNVPKGVVTTIRQVSTEPTIEVPLGALTQLVVSGVSVSRASEIITSLMRRGVTPRQLASFSNDVNSDVKLGGRPDDALSVRMRGLTAALAPPGAASAATTGFTVSAPKKP